MLASLRTLCQAYLNSLMRRPLYEITVSVSLSILISLTRQDLLIIDEFGMKIMPKNNADDVMKTIHRRYHQSSTIIATNRSLEDWVKILGDNVATSAILDRFLDKAKIAGCSIRSALVYHF